MDVEFTYITGAMWISIAWMIHGTNVGSGPVAFPV